MPVGATKSGRTTSPDPAGAPDPAEAGTSRFVVPLRGVVVVVVDAVVDVVRAALIFALTSLNRASSSMMRQLISEEKNNILP